MQKYLKFIYPIIAFVILIFINYVANDILVDILVYTFKIWFDFFINSNGEELLRQVDIVSKRSGEISFLTAFIDLYNFEQSPVKIIDIVVFNEFVLPIIFYISFVIIFIKKNIKFFILSLFSLVFLLWIKIVISIYDNYSHPDFILKELSFPFSQIVYYTNAILSYVGTSFSLMLSVIFVVMFLILKTDIMNKWNVNNS